MAFLIRIASIGLEACVGEGPKAEGTVMVSAGVRSKTLGGDVGSFRLASFESEAEGLKALEAGFREAFGRNAQLEVSKGDAPGWFLSMSVFMFPGVVSVTTGTAMVVGAFRALDAGKSVREVMDRVWRQRAAVAPPAPPASLLQGQEKQIGEGAARGKPVMPLPAASIVVDVREMMTTAPWRQSLGMMPVGYLKARWIRRPKGLDGVLGRLTRR